MSERIDRDMCTAGERYRSTGWKSLIYFYVTHFQSNSLTGLAHINFMNNNQGFLQFIKEVKDRVEQCFANVKTELTIPVGLVRFLLFFSVNKLFTESANKACCTTQTGSHYSSSSVTKEQA